jgi:hypothetical protein
MDLEMDSAHSFDGFSIDGWLWQKIHFCGIVTIPISCSMTRGIEWTQLEFSKTSYTGATSVLRSVRLLIKHNSCSRHRQQLFDWGYQKWHVPRIMARTVHVVRNRSELRGATPLLPPKKGPPPTHSSEALFSKKINENFRKRTKIVKNAKSR